MLLGVPFALIGLVTVVSALWPIFRSLQAQDWRTVPAEIHDAKVVSSRSSKGGTTYKLEAHYSYEVDGRRYESSSVSFYASSDNIDSFHQERFAQLKPFIGTSEKFRTYVNPSDPQDAVLFPEIRWGASGLFAILGGVFFVAGSGLIIGTRIGLKRARERAHREAEHPRQPWMVRKDWADRRVTCNGILNIVFLAVVAAIWNGVSAFVPLAVYKELQGNHPNYVIFVFLIFPLIGCALLWGLAVMFFRWKRFGTSELSWAANPLSSGDEFVGTLIASSRLLEVGVPLEVSLTCLESRTTGSGKNRSTRTTTLVEEKVTVALSPGFRRNDRAHIPIKISIPSGGKPTLESGNPRYSWKLRTHASIPGADYDAEFILPIFGTKED